jgi:hypothetical protein
VVGGEGGQELESLGGALVYDVQARIELIICEPLLYVKCVCVKRQE